MTSKTLQNGSSNVGANVFVYRPTGTARGQVYTDMEKCYADVLKATASTTQVGGTQDQGFISLIIDATTFPARPANAAYNLDGVTLVLLPNGGTVTLADGVNFAGSSPTYGIPYFTGSELTNVVFECLTTSLYTGPAADLKFISCYSFNTDPLATVPAFHFNSGTSTNGIYLSFTTLNISDTGGSAIFRLTGGTDIWFYLMDWATIWNNPFTDSGLSTEVVTLWYQASNIGSGSSYEDPFARVLGTTITVIPIATQLIEEISAEEISSVSSLKIPVTPPWETTNQGYKTTHLAEAFVKTPYYGAVIPTSMTTIGSTGSLFTGISHDTATVSLGIAGWATNFVTGAIIGNTSGWATTTNEAAKRGAQFYSAFSLQHLDITNTRGFWGLTGTHIGASRTGAVGTNTPTGDLIGLQVRDTDVNYFFLTQQSAGVANRIDTGIALTASGLLLIIDARNTTMVKLLLCDPYGEVLASHEESTAGNLPLLSSWLGMCGILETRAASTANWTHVFAQMSVGLFN